MSKTAKIAKIVVFRYFFKQKLHCLAMMCVKECLHTFLLQINQINKIKHSGNAQKRQKTRLMCFMCINFNGKLIEFFVDPARYCATQRHDANSDFYKNGLKSSSRLKKKSQEVSVRKMSTSGDITKNVGRGDSAPGSFRVRTTVSFR